MNKTTSGSTTRWAPEAGAEDLAKMTKGQRNARACELLCGRVADPACTIAAVKLCTVCHASALEIGRTAPCKG